jgi:hypothetical protein
LNQFNSDERWAVKRASWRLKTALGLGRVRTLYGMERDDLGEVAM